jgi:short-subunit dehydrogenase
MADPKNQYALITGATSGIGYELAKLFAIDGYNLVIVARNHIELQNKANEFSGEYGVRVHTIVKDLSIEAGPFEVYDEVKAKGIEVEILVNDAAQGQYGKFVETDIQRELELVRLNIMGYLVLTKLFLKEMVARNSGKILQVSSIGAAMPAPLQSVYHATKAFINSHGEAVRYELRETNVNLTILMPGPTDTDFFNKAEAENTVVVQDMPLDDPAKVAKDGYEALMKGKDKVIHGLRNKAQVAMANMLPDETVAGMINKQMQPSDKKEE